MVRTIYGESGRTMKPLQFFKAHSRLGLLNFPDKSKEFDLGVEDAPDAILSESFLSGMKDARVFSFVYPKPEAVEKNRYFETVARSAQAFARVISECADDRRLQIVVGGDHSVTLASMASLLQRKNPDKLGYIHIDSHGDLMSVSTSHTGNFHGMFLRALVGTFDHLEVEGLVPIKVPAQNVLFIGNLDLEPVEKNFISDHRFSVISGKSIAQDRQGVTQTLRGFLSRYTHIHVSFDIDVFDGSLVTATGTPSSGGMFPQEIFPLLEMIALASSLSFDVVEVNPKMKGGAEAVRLAQEVILALSR